MFVPFPATSPTMTLGAVLAPEPPLPAPAYTSRCPAPEGWDHSHPLHVLRASEKPVPCRRMPVPLYGHSQSPSKTHLRSPLPSASVLEMSSSSCPRVGQGSRTAAPSLKKELRVPFSSLPPPSPSAPPQPCTRSLDRPAHRHRHRQQAASAPRWCWPRTRLYSRGQGC